MGVVNEPIEDRVGDGRVADQFVLVIDGKLAGHDGRGQREPASTRHSDAVRPAMV